MTNNTSSNYNFALKFFPTKLFFEVLSIETVTMSDAEVDVSTDAPEVDDDEKKESPRKNVKFSKHLVHI